jgi:hypothetical protein
MKASSDVDPLLGIAQTSRSEGSASGKRSQILPRVLKKKLVTSAGGFYIPKHLCSMKKLFLWLLLLSLLAWLWWLNSSVRLPPSQW